MPDKYSDVVSQAAEDNWIYHRGSAEHAKYIHHYHMMNYDCTASDDPVSESCAHLCLSHPDLRLRTINHECASDNIVVCSGNN